jgi:small subunit ribosomal protein S21
MAIEAAVHYHAPFDVDFSSGCPAPHIGLLKGFRNGRGFVAAGGQFFDGKAYAVVANALVHLQLVRQGRSDPETAVGAGIGGRYHLAGAFNDSRKHRPQDIQNSGRERGFRSAQKQVPIFFGGMLPFIIFAILKTPEEVYKFMLIIDSKDCENIDKALKKYKKKFEKSKTLLQLRERQAFIKPSVVRRTEVLKAIYKQNIASGKIEN